MSMPTTVGKRHDESAVAGVPRESYSSISLYSPVRVPVDIDLSDNTNQWGTPPSVARTLSSLDPSLVSQYPQQPMIELDRALARFVGVDDVDAIVTGCGSDDLLDCVMRAFAQPGDVVAHADPSFSMIPYFARTNGLVPAPVPFRDGFNVDVGAMLALNPRVIYLCAPNNPTGTGISEEDIARILDAASGIVVLDEAYAEFATSSWAARASSQGRLIVTRTLSKAFGLAGLRIGYAVGAPELVLEIAKARGPYKVNAVAQQIALNVLQEDVSWVRERAADAVEARSWLFRELSADGLRPIPSQANFILVPFDGAPRCAATMAARGIQLRAFTALPGIGDALRITVAPVPSLLMMLRTLRAITNELKEASSVR